MHTRMHKQTNTLSPSPSRTPTPSCVHNDVVAPEMKGCVFSRLVANGAANTWLLPVSANYNEQLTLISLA